MGFASGCLKCCLNTFNVLWGISSIIILACAAMFVNLIPPIITTLLFITGGIGLIIAILGCCGICQEHPRLTMAYAIFIGISLLIQIGGTIYMKYFDEYAYATAYITKLWNEEQSSPGAMDITQSLHHCCGKDGPHDYLPREVPDSCYPPPSSYQNSDPYSKGCIEVSAKDIKIMMNYLLSTSWGHIIFTIMLMLFAFYLIVRFRRKQRYNY